MECHRRSSKIKKYIGIRDGYICKLQMIIPLISNIIIGKGDRHTYTFINVKTSSVSKEFDDISAWNSRKTAYALYKDGVIKIIVQDICDKDYEIKQETIDL